MIPVNSILEITESYDSLGFSYLSHAFGDGTTPKRMTYLAVRSADGHLVMPVFVPAEVL